MKSRYFSIAAMTVFALGMLTSSCKRGTTIGAVGYPDNTPDPIFDTFDFPTEKYFFYGKFDGKFILWQHALRSSWDTATRDSNSVAASEGKPWSEWPKYEENIYYNFSQQTQVGECRYDSTFNRFYYEQKTRFIRPEFEDRRIEINFYDCVNTADTLNPYYPFNEQSIFRLGANPFTDVPFGRQGVRVTYFDEKGDRWSTKAGSGQTLDTYFRITDFYAKDPVDSLDTFALYVIEGEFAGRLFSELTSEEKIVTEAKFRARVVPRDPSQ